MIPKTNTSSQQKRLSIIFIMLPFLASAQDSFFDNTNDTTPAAPIDGYLLLMVLLGICVAYLFFKKQNQLKNKIIIP